MAQQSVAVLFLNTKPNSTSTENCLCTSDGFECGKIVGFWQHWNSNSNSRHSRSVQW